MLALFRPPLPEYPATPTSNAGQIARPVEFCLIPRNMYWFRKSILPVSVNAPGLGSAGVGATACLTVAAGCVACIASLS